MTFQNMLIIGYSFFVIFSAVTLWLINNMFNQMQAAALQKTDDFVGVLTFLQEKVMINSTVVVFIWALFALALVMLVIKNERAHKG